MTMNRARVRAALCNQTAITGAPVQAIYRDLRPTGCSVHTPQHTQSEQLQIAPAVKVPPQYLDVIDPAQALQFLITPA